MQVSRLLGQYDLAARFELKTAIVTLMRLGFFEQVKREIREMAIDALLTNDGDDKAVKLLSKINIENHFIIRLHALMQEILSQGGATE